MARTLIVSHAHPLIKGGGGEVAAHRQFEHMRELGEDAWFLGAVFTPSLVATLFPNQSRILEIAPRDHVFRASPMDADLLEQTSQEDEDMLLKLLLRYEADVIHFHHFWNIGAGVIRRLRAARPEACLICTLHEFTALCLADGQMVKRNNNELCTRASPVSCALCFPDFIPAYFLVRQRRMAEMMDCFNLIISPSQFLANRFIEAGLDPGKLKVLENGLLPAHGDEAIDAEDRYSRFAYFGQATPTKGLDVLLRAVRRALIQDDKTSFSLDIHGVTEERFRELWPKEPEIPEVVRFRGTYRPAEAIGLMRSYGWVVVPSVWWENSPVVIQEARMAGTPVIASGIGGMKEKVGDWGRLFPVGDSESLSRLILTLAADPSAHRNAVAQITPPLMIADYFKLWQAEVAAT